MLRLVCCFFYGSVMILLNDAETSFVTVGEKTVYEAK